jgi:hypothetical protein
MPHIRDGFPKEEHVKRYLMTVIVALVAATGCQEAPKEPQEPFPTLSADLNQAARNWKAMSEDDQAAVCMAASGPLPGEGEVGGAAPPTPGASASVDYRGMLEAIEEAGHSQPEAAAMLPYALNECR